MNEFFNVAYNCKDAIAAFAVLLIFMIAMRNLQKLRPYTYLALGDSYTIGEKVQPQDNFPNQIISMLRDHHYEMEDPVIIATTGWTTAELGVALIKANLHKTFDFVTLLIGVNNQYRGMPALSYAPGFRSLLSKAIRLAGDEPPRVIVLSIPDWGATPFAAGRDRQKIAKEIDRYNAAARKIAMEKSAQYLDITHGTRIHALDATMLAEDGLHPSAKEYEIWARQVVNVVKQQL